MTANPYPQGTPSDPPNDPNPDTAIQRLREEVAEQYVPLDGQSIFLPATRWASTAGSPTLNGSNALGPGWLLDGSTNESIGCVSDPFPPGWATFRVDLLWTNAGAGSGDVKFLWIDGGADIGFAAGDTIAYAYDASLIVTAPAQNVLAITTLVATRTVVADHPLNIFRIDRTPSDAADTLANDMRVYGVRLVRLS